MVSGGGVWLGVARGIALGGAIAPGITRSGEYSGDVWSGAAGLWFEPGRDRDRPACRRSDGRLTLRDFPRPRSPTLHPGAALRHRLDRLHHRDRAPPRHSNLIQSETTPPRKSANQSLHDRDALGIGQRLRHGDPLLFWPHPGDRGGDGVQCDRLAGNPVRALD